MPAIGAAGGIIVAWKQDKFTMLSHTLQDHSVMVEFQFNFDRTFFRLTAVYGPPSPAGRQQFLSELASQQPDIHTPWIILGDFNQTLSTTDRSNIHRQPDAPFVSLVATLGLIDLPLTGRQYTWSRGTQNPTFVRLDRIMISNAWSLKFPNTIQTALYSTLSDHCPIQCTINTTFPLPNTFRFENYWLKFPKFTQLVTTEWQTTPAATNPLQLSLKLQKLRKRIRQWTQHTTAAIHSHTGICTQILMSITRIQENRPLTNLETLLNNLIKERLAQIDDLKEIRWKQRAKRQWLQQGDKNTAYFHAIASHQKRINSITRLQSQGADTSQHSSKAAILFNHFCSLMGTSEPAHPIFDLHTIFADTALSQPEKDTLIQPWTEKDIKQAVHSWKNSKSPGPDGFTVEFYNSFI